MKPKTPDAMRQLILQVRQALPFALKPDEACGETCSHGCPLKLLDFLDSELEAWWARLDAGEVPRLADVQKLARTSRKIYNVLEKNRLAPPQS